MVDFGEKCRMTECLTITELATMVGMTARNIRAHQSRGLLASPRIEGRTARYGSDHVARLELISSLQREGFTLAAIKRMIDSPDSYASIVADRRRHFRDDTSDIVATVPAAVDRIRAVRSGLEQDLIDAGVIWMQDGELVIHTLLVGIGRTLTQQGLPPGLLADLVLDSARTAASAGLAFRDHVEAQDGDDRRLGDLAKVAVQLGAAAFELAFLGAASTANSGNARA
jgi:DNA-binding transcriptional MerR regulator